jgi:uncharacterized repeat protein (TIGR03803 family)
MWLTLLTRLVRLAIAATALAVAVTTAVNAQQQGTEYTALSSFNAPFIDGRQPSSLRQANDGNFYGTTSGGGITDQGTLFRMDATGAVTPLETFSGTDGAQPFGLVRAADGQFYGMTAQGGEFGWGTVFRFSPAGGLTTLHSFSATDSRYPVDLFPASDGNVYGLTAGGGDFDNGTIFKVAPDGSVTTIYNFDLSAGSGMRSLVKGSDGRFYVTAEGGGAEGFGTVFTVDDAGTPTILHSFGGFEQEDGESPWGLIQGRDGRLYGATRRGGQFSDGTLFSIDVSGNYIVLHHFSSSIDGSQPGPDLLQAADGYFYGVTQFTRRVFRIDSTGAFTVLNPLAESSPGELIQGADGRLYGAAGDGGLDGGGTIFTFDVPGPIITLHPFTIGDSVGRPVGVIQARNGQFYGTTTAGTRTGRGITGTVFAMDAAGARTTLHTFQIFVTSLVFEGQPLSNLFEGNDGGLYGTTFNEFDSPIPPGQIFRITPEGVFTKVSSSYLLRAGVIQARDGRWYGTSAAASQPQLRNFGSVFRVEADGTRTVLHQLDGTTDSANPIAELVEIDDGSLYGVTEGSGGPFGPGPPPPIAHGTIFRVDPATGAFVTRYRFSGPDGSKPLGRLIQGTDGLIYGTTVAGGNFGFGTVFSLDAAGTLTTLHHFAGPDGANPSAGVIQGLDGRLYGTTTNGGVFGYGTVFAMDVTGVVTTLHDLAWADGANPVTELIQATDGAFYGAASSGGPTGGGVIFRVRVATSTPDRFFEIVSRNSGKCLDVFGASTDAAAPVIQWTCHGGQNQQWRLEPVGGSAFQIIARHSGQALDVFGASLDDVTPIIQYPVHGGDNQVWTIEPTSDGYVRIIARHSGKAMDVEFASVDDGARVIQYTPHGGANQQWLLRGVESTAAP